MLAPFAAHFRMHDQLRDRFGVARVAELAVPLVAVLQRRREVDDGLRLVEDARGLLADATLRKEKTRGGKQGFQGVESNAQVPGSGGGSGLLAPVVRRKPARGLVLGRREAVARGRRQLDRRVLLLHFIARVAVARARLSVVRALPHIASIVEDLACPLHEAAVALFRAFCPRHPLGHLAWARVGRRGDGREAEAEEQDSGAHERG